MNKLLTILLSLSFMAMSVGCATKPYTGQTNYAVCKLNPDAVYPHEATGEPTKCTDKLTVRRGSHMW